MIGYQFLIEADTETLLGVPETLRFCCSPGYTGGGHTWLPYIVDPGLLKFALFTGGLTTGPSTASYGEVVLSNQKDAADITGPLDLLKNHLFYGRSIRMYVCLPDALFPSEVTQVYTAIVAEQPLINGDTFTLPLKGRQYELESPLDGGTFAGDNILPDGLEGTSELKDKDKPVMLGRPANVTLTQCNTTKLIYAASPLTGLSADELGANLHVEDNGVELYCSQVTNDIENSIPAKGTYAADPRGYIRTGSSPIGPLTCTGAALGYALTGKPANLTSQVLTLSGHADMIDATSFAAHAAVDGYERGLFLPGKTPIAQIIDALIAPGGYWHFSPTGKMILGLLADPATLQPVYSFDASVNITRVLVRPALDTSGGAPASEVILRYNRNHTVLQQPAAGVPESRKSWLAQEWQTRSRINTTTVQPASEAMTVDTACTNANALHLDQLETFYCTERELVDIDVTPEEFLAVLALPPGACVSLDLQGRFGYSGKNMLIDSGLINFVREAIQLTLWG